MDIDFFVLGGKAIEKMAAGGNPLAFQFPVPLANERYVDLSVNHH